MSIPEIAARLSVGRRRGLQMLEQGVIPAIRLGRRWIVTRHAFEEWEKTCGTGGRAWPAPGLLRQHRAQGVTDVVMPVYKRKYRFGKGGVATTNSPWAPPARIRN